MGGFCPVCIFNRIKGVNGSSNKTYKKYNTPNQESFMRKILTKIVTLVLIVAMSVTTFTACGLVSVNTERDMAQTVAVVDIDLAEGTAAGTDTVDAEEIKKSEMISAFMSYGYMYVQSYGQTTEQVYQMILDNLVQNRIIIQGARRDLAKTYNDMLSSQEEPATEFLKYFKANATANGVAINSKSGESENLKKYLTAYEIAQANYNVKKSINQMIDSYAADEEETEEKEDETYEVRATPTADDEVPEYEYEFKTHTPSEDDYKVALLTLKGKTIGDPAVSVESVADLKGVCANSYDLSMAVYENYTIDLSTNARIKAFNKAIADLKTNGIIGEDESQDVRANAENALNYSYFVKSLKSQYESLIVSKYEDSLIVKAEAGLTNKAIYEQYEAEYNAQKENYNTNVSGYESALDAVTKDTFVLCNPYTGYGYVLNLLIGFSTEQSAELSAAKSKVGATAKDIADARSALLGKLQAKDQRETWVYSSYGNYDATNGFTFDSKYFVSEAGSVAYNTLSKFAGNVYGATSSEEEDENGVLQTVWSFENVRPTAMGMDAFLTNYFNPLLGTALSTTNLTATVTLDDTARAAFDDLLYAFNTDPGALGSYLGYTYSPYNSKTTYVKEFADAAARVVANGVGAIEMVATDFGYHIILCTKVVGEEFYADQTAFETALNNKDSLAYKYREIKLDSIVSTEVGKIADMLINGYFEDEHVVSYNTKAYEDLIPAESTSDEHAGHNHNH